MDEVPKLVEQIRSGVPPLPNKQLHLRKSTDPNAAARALPPTATPDPWSTSYGPPMGDTVTGPPAAIEQPPEGL
jgi:hypothetical protein